MKPSVTTIAGATIVEGLSGVSCDGGHPLSLPSIREFSGLLLTATGSAPHFPGVMVGILPKDVS